MSKEKLPSGYPKKRTTREALVRMVEAKIPPPVNPATIVAYIQNLYVNEEMGTSAIAEFLRNGNDSISPSTIIKIVGPERLLSRGEAVRRNWRNPLQRRDHIAKIQKPEAVQKRREALTGRTRPASDLEPAHEAARKKGEDVMLWVEEGLLSGYTHQQIIDSAPIPLSLPQVKRWQAKLDPDGTRFGKRIKGVVPITLSRKVQSLLQNPQVLEYLDTITDERDMLIVREMIKSNNLSSRQVGIVLDLTSARVLQRRNNILKKMREAAK